jgi:hypothetical protein
VQDHRDRDYRKTFATNSSGFGDGAISKKLREG